MSIEGNTSNREIVIKRLIISPNLDALLEQEDKTRAQLAPVSEMPPSTLSPRSVSSGEECLVGLPPPPRHPRVKLPRSTSRAVKANLTLDTELQAKETPAKPAKPAKPAPSILVESPLSISSSISNPFINPAPTLAQLHNIQRDREPSNLQIPELSSLESDSHDGSESSPSPIVFSSPWSTVDPDSPTRIPGYRHRHLNSVDSHIKPWRLLQGKSYAKRQSTTPGNARISPSREPAYAARNQSSISISSTVYPPSDSYSYNDPVPSNSENNHSLSHSVSIDCPQISPIRFSRRLSDSWPSIYSNLSLPSSNPDLPTLEPNFYSTSINPEISRPLPRPLPPIPTASRAPLSPTTNFLDSAERADLVRKTRKLARVFGKTPGPDDIPVQEISLSMSRNSSDSDWSQSPVSQSDEVRRHSAPLSPDDVYSMSSQGSLSPPKDKAGDHVLNDTFDGGDTASVMLETDKIIKPLPIIPTQSQSQSKTMSDEDEQADERRRKREKLAKLHRFLGSRVPINLVLGTDIEPSLPTPYISPIGPLYRNEDGQTTWLKRRRSSSAIPHWSNDLERVKEELNDQEKFINVRRAVKMEKVFGVAPPQTLYHTRHCSSPQLPGNKSPPSDGPSLTGSSQRTSKRSTYLKQKPKKNSRPGTADSDMHLVPKVQETSNDVVANAWGIGHSNIYNSYQFSLNSLQDILAWDDRESLVELHQYLNTEEVGPKTPGDVPTLAAGNRLSSASFFGRRRSLPVLSSRISLESEYSVTLPETNDTGFQVRRRKAAKLTQFFGVDYRELINDVLQSIEHGVKNEHKSGTLRAEEAEDLLARLRNLKIKQPKSQSFLHLD